MTECCTASATVAVAATASSTTDFCTATAAGAASRTVTAPLDRVKVVLQLHRGTPLGVWGAVKKIWRDERSLLLQQQQQQQQQFKPGQQVVHAHGAGSPTTTRSSTSSSSSRSVTPTSNRLSRWHLMWACRGFFRGNLTNCVKVVPETAIKFWAYDYIKQRLLAYKKKQQHDTHSSKSSSSTGLSPAVVTPTVATLSPMSAAAAAATSLVPGPQSPAAAAATSLITPPVVSRTAISTAAAVAPTSTALTRSPHTAEAAAYPLLQAATAAPPPAVGGIAAAGEGTAAAAAEGTTAVTIGDKLLCGALAGMIGQLAVYPMEIVKTRLAAYSPTCRYDGIFSCLAKTFQQGGLRKLYRGLGPSLLGIIPYAGIDLALFDTLKNLYMSIHCKQQQEVIVQHQQQHLQEQQRMRQRSAAASGLQQDFLQLEKEQQQQQGRVSPGVCLEQQEQQEVCVVPAERSVGVETAVQQATSETYANVLLGSLRQWGQTSRLREEIDPAAARDAVLLGARLRAPGRRIPKQEQYKQQQQQQGMRSLPEWPTRITQQQHEQQQHHHQQLQQEQQQQEKKMEKDEERHDEKRYAQWKLSQLPSNIPRQQQEQESTHARSPPVYILLLCGGISSLCGQVVAYPTALVRTRVQIDGSNGTAPKYSNSWQAARCALRDGWQGLYRGMGANLAKAVPAVSISWIVYEKSKDFILYAVETHERRHTFLWSSAKSTARWS